MTRANPDRDADEPRGVRFPPAILKRITALAESQHSTLTAVVVRAVELALPILEDEAAATRAAADELRKARGRGRR